MVVIGLVRPIAHKYSLGANNSVALHFTPFTHKKSFRESRRFKKFPYRSQQFPVFSIKLSVLQFFLGNKFHLNGQSREICGVIFGNGLKCAGQGKNR